MLLAPWTDSGMKNADGITIMQRPLPNGGLLKKAVYPDANGRSRWSLVRVLRQSEQPLARPMRFPRARRPDVFRPYEMSVVSIMRTGNRIERGEGFYAQGSKKGSKLVPHNPFGPAQVIREADGTVTYSFFMDGNPVAGPFGFHELRFGADGTLKAALKLAETSLLLSKLIKVERGLEAIGCTRKEARRFRPTPRPNAL